MPSEIVLHVEGLEFRADNANDEPRVLDVIIGERVGLSRPRDVRKTIRRHIAAGFLCDSDVRATVARRQHGVVERESEEYWLTEVGALKLITKLETPFAHALVGDMVRVYRAAISELRCPRGASPRAEIELVNGPRIADDPRMRDRLRKMIMGAAAVTGRSHQAIHGALRKGIRPTSSICLASQLHYEKLCDDVLDITDGRRLLPAPRPGRALAPVVDIRQTRLPFPPRNAS